MGWGMSTEGLTEFTTEIQMNVAAARGATDVWEIGPETDYDVYVELGTTRMIDRPCVKFGAENAMKALDELERKSKSPNDLLRLLALRIEEEIKKSMTEVIYEHPLGSVTPTGDLRRSVEANKR